MGGLPWSGSTRMRWSGWAVVTLALLNGAYMVFDGFHAFLTGDFVTPDSGEYAGQLGPWAALVEGVGLDPRGVFMKSVFVALGASWLAAAGLYTARIDWAWIAVASVAVGTLWYLVVGTGVSAVVLSLVLTRRFLWSRPPSRHAGADAAPSPNPPKRV